VIWFVHSKIAVFRANEKEKGACIFVLIFKKIFSLSHVPQRKEKDCLNCGATVQGRYCQDCGQENIVPKETFWHMFTHFFYDITHFDSSFFTSARDLIFRPGFLSKEYMIGRRKRYLHPIRMYVFSSAIFFLVFFKFFGPQIKMDEPLNMPVTKEERLKYIQELEEGLKKDTADVNLKAALLVAKDTAHQLLVSEMIKTAVNNKGIKVGFSDSNYKTEAEYDSVQEKKSKAARDGWFMRRLNKKVIDLNTRYKENPEEFKEKFLESFLHRLPYMLFVSLPIFALLLKLLYFRRKNFYYADHGVFTIHLYVFTFLCLLLVFALDKLQDVVTFEFFGWAIFFIMLGHFIYLLKAMRMFYDQRRWKTIFKGILIAFISFIMMCILLIFFMFFSAATF